MKAIVSIFLASFILFFSAGLRIATHYCGDTVVESALTTNLTVEGCGMEDSSVKTCSSTSESSEASPKSCCSDEVTSLHLEDDYQVSNQIEKTFDLQFVTAFVAVYFDLVFNKKDQPEYLSLIHI